jgi:hypothetical protein
MPFFKEGLFMSHFRFARLALMLAAIGLNAAPALMHSANAQDKNAQAAAPKPETVRPELFKLLDPAQLRPLLDAKNFTEMQNRLTQADALPNKTPYEEYVVNSAKLQLASSSGNAQGTIAPLEALIASGRLAGPQKVTFTTALAEAYYNTKNYPKAIEVYKQAEAAGAPADSINPALVRAYYLTGDNANSMKLQRSMLEASEKAGKTPTQEDIRLYYSAAVKAKDDAAALFGLEKLAAYYPSDEFWADLVNRGVARKPGFADANDEDLLRLHFAAEKAMAPEYYATLAELALKDGFPTEAKKVMDAGYAAGVLGSKNNALRDRANKEAANDAKTIASGETAAARTGTGLVNLGWAYVTMEQYDKGIGFIERGIAKGGLKQPDEAKLRLGMAYARAGQKDKAIQTFQTIKAGGGLSDLAHYWIVLLNHPNTGGSSKQAAK